MQGDELESFNIVFSIVCEYMYHNLENYACPCT
jgi:hypothetical protein